MWDNALLCTHLHVRLLYLIPGIILNSELTLLTTAAVFSFLVFLLIVLPMNKMYSISIKGFPQPFMDYCTHTQIFNMIVLYKREFASSCAFILISFRCILVNLGMEPMHVTRSKTLVLEIMTSALTVLILLENAVIPQKKQLILLLSNVHQKTAGIRCFRKLKLFSLQITMFATHLWNYVSYRQDKEGRMYLKMGSYHILSYSLFNIFGDITKI